MMESNEKETTKQGAITRKFLWKRDPAPHQHPVKSFKVTATPLPSIVDLRLQCPPVYDQGSLGSCTANAIGFIFQYLKMKEAKTINPQKPKHIPIPSRLFIYYNERVIEDTIDEDAGAIISSGISSLKTKGCCNETPPIPYWPYDVGKYSIKPSDECYKIAFNNRISKASRIEQSALQLKTALSEGRPIVFGFEVYSNIDKVTSDGLLGMPQDSDQYCGGHAVAIVGYNEPKRYFIVRNSWGSNWGDKGYFYMPYEYALSIRYSGDFWILQK